MSVFTPTRNVRLGSLTVGAIAQVRFGQAAVKNDADVIVVAKLVEKRDEGDKAILVFEETGAEGTAALTTVSKYPGAAWRSEAKADSNSKYVSLAGVDETTFPLTKPASPVATGAIDQALVLIQKERNDVYAPDELAALLTEVSTGKRVTAEIKAKAIALAEKLVKELSSEPDNEA